MATASSAPTHSVEVEADLVLIRIVGSLSVADSQHIYQHCDRSLAERGYCLALFDLRRAAVPSRESRKWISHWFRQRDVRRVGVATFGTSLIVRTVNRMFDSSVSLLSGQPAPTRHCSNEGEARAWLDMRRIAVRERGFEAT